MSNPWEIQTIEYDKTNAEGNAEVSGYGQISILLNKYVLKEKGKGLSSNDFTDNDVQKLKSIEVGAETNKLETLTINGGVKIYPNDEKNINLPIPTKVSQLDNDLGYAKLINMSHDDDFSDSYVGKAKFAFQDEENIAIGKNSNVEHGGIAIGKNTATSETYDINIGNELLHNRISDIWEGKTSSSLSADVAMKNTNGTNLTQLDVVIEDLATETQNRIDADGVLQDNIDTETRNRINADETLQDNIDAEITNRNDADMTLQNNINAETQNRIDADNSLSNDIGTEASIRQNADDLLASDISNVSSRITSIEDKIEPNYTSVSLTQVTSDTTKYIKVADCNIMQAGTLQVYLGGGHLIDTLVINFGSGTALEPMLCGYYSGNDHAVYSVIAQKGSDWNQSYSIYVKVRQSTDCNVNVALLKGDCTVNITESTTAPTNIYEWTVNYGLFGNITSPEIISLEQRVSALESKL